MLAQTLGLFVLMGTLAAAPDLAVFTLVMLWAVTVLLYVIDESRACVHRAAGSARTTEPAEPEESTSE